MGDAQLAGDGFGGAAAIPGEHHLAVDLKAGELGDSGDGAFPQAVAQEDGAGETRAIGHQNRRGADAVGFDEQGLGVFDSVFGEERGVAGANGASAYRTFGAAAGDDRVRALVADGRLTPPSSARPRRAPRLVKTRASASALVIGERDAER